MRLDLEELLNPDDHAGPGPAVVDGRDMELVEQGVSLLAALFDTFLEVGGLHEVRRRAVEDLGLSEEDADRLYYLLDEGVIAVDYVALPGTEQQ